MSTGKRWTYRALASLGVFGLVIGASLELWAAVTSRPLELPHSVYIVSAALGFIGFYGLNPPAALGGGSFLVDAATRLIVAVRSGRRSSDRIEVTATAAKPFDFKGQDPPPPVEPS